MILACSCSKYKGDKDSLNYDTVIIQFDGYSERYEIDEMITIPVVNANDIRRMNELKNLSERKWFGNVKGTDYIIRIIYTNTETGDELLVRILKSIDSTPSIEYGSGTIFDSAFKNDKLVDLVSRIINLEGIERYNGSLNQNEYESNIKGK